VLHRDLRVRVTEQLRAAFDELVDKWGQRYPAAETY
jgi:hypothetical protein